MKKQNVYEEHEKLKSVKNESEIIGQFLEWQKTKDRDLCTFDSKFDEFTPVFHGSIEKILGEYFEIDLNKLEKEKQQMIEGLRCVNGANPKK